MMGIREAINANKPLGYGVTSVIIVAAAGLAIWANSSGFPSNSTHFFFSDDDGKTYFADAVTKVPPFDHNGKTAHQAMVYRVGSNPPFVGYLQSYKPEAAKEISQILNGGKDIENGMRLNELRADPLVKRPGDAAWHIASSEAGRKTVNIDRPAGQTGDFQAVYP